MSLNLGRLNQKQREAVLHGNGPLLVLAGAGSGKTSTMTYRIAHLISERHVAGAQILGLSFTNKAAKELKERVRDLVRKTSGPRAARGITVTTFHSLCVRILRKHAGKIGYSGDFSIIDQGDQVDILRRILRGIKVDDRKFDPRTILFQIGQAKNRFLVGEKATEYFLQSKSLPGDYGIAAASSYERYMDQLQGLNGMDFDDLLFNTVRLLRDHEDVRNEYNDLFRYVLVDEYQDTNETQFQLLRLLTEKQQNICVVGDDDQSIYSWRGANPTHILRFGDHYPGAERILLEQNYRSTNTILTAANEMIRQNKQRYDKRLWSKKGDGEPILSFVLEDERAEADLVADEILRKAREPIEGRFEQVRPWKDFAVLYRSNTQSRLIEEAFRMRQIPYSVVGGMSYLDRKEIKDTLSYWRLLVNPLDDASFRRIVNYPARGIGKGTLTKIGEKAVEGGVSYLEACNNHDLGLRASSLGKVKDFLGTLKNLRDSLETCPVEPASLSEWAKFSLETIGMKGAIEGDTDDVAQAARRWDSVLELANGLGQVEIAENDERTSLQILGEYLSRLALDAQDQENDDSKKDKKKDEVTLMTLHGSKGLEFPTVFMIGLEEELLPHKRSIAEANDLSEERRLCYVGITRAQKELYLTRAKNRIKWGKKVPRYPCRFLADIPDELLVFKDESDEGFVDLSSTEAQEEHEVKVKNFLASIRNQISSG